MSSKTSHLLRGLLVFAVCVPVSVILPILVWLTKPMEKWFTGEASGLSSAMERDCLLKH